MRADPIPLVTQGASAQTPKQDGEGLRSSINPSKKLSDQQGVFDAESLIERQAIILAVVAELLDQEDLERALDAFLGALQTRFDAYRVSVSLITKNGQLSLAAISQQALLEMATDEARLLTEVMEECLDHECLVCFPQSDSAKGMGVLAAHRSLGSRRDRTSLISVPFFHDEEAVG